MKITGTMIHTLIVCMALALTAQHADAISDRAAANVDRKARAAAGAAPHVAAGAGAGHHAGAAPDPRRQAVIDKLLADPTTAPGVILKVLNLKESAARLIAITNLRTQKIVPNALNMQAYAILQRLKQIRDAFKEHPTTKRTIFEAARLFLQSGMGGKHVTEKQLRWWKDGTRGIPKESKRN